MVNECIATHTLQTQIQLVKRLIEQGQEVRTFVTEKNGYVELKNRVMDTQWDRNKRLEQNVRVDEPCSLCCGLPHHTVLPDTEQGYSSSVTIIWDVTAD